MTTFTELCRIVSDADCLLRAVLETPKLANCSDEQWPLLSAARFPNIAHDWSPRHHRTDAAILHAWAVRLGVAEPNTPFRTWVRDLTATHSPKIEQLDSTTTKPDGIRRNITWLLWALDRRKAAQLCRDVRPKWQQRAALYVDWWMASQRYLAAPYDYPECVPRDYLGDEDDFWQPHDDALWEAMAPVRAAVRARTVSDGGVFRLFDGRSAADC